MDRERYEKIKKAAEAFDKKYPEYLNAINLGWFITSLFTFGLGLIFGACIW